MGLISDLFPSIDEILGVRDELGVALKEVFIVTRVWSGQEPGDGIKTDTKVLVVPSPRVVELRNNYRAREAGEIKGGEIVLKMISKESYPLRANVDCNTTLDNEEKFFEVDGQLYSVSSLTEKHLYWNVYLSPLSGRFS